MITIYQLKPAFQTLLRPVVGQLARRGVSANGVTLAATLASIVVGGLIAAWPEAAWPLLVLPVFLFVRMALNAIDGMLAREHQQQSRLGAILNELGDAVSDAALYLPLALVSGFSPALVVGVVVLALIGEMTGILGPSVGASRRYDGPMGKSDRAFVFGALALWAGLGLPAQFAFDWILGAMALLAAWTIFNRARKALAEGDSGHG